MRFFTLFIFICISLNAQNFDYIATYNIEFNTDFPASYASTLLMNSEKNNSYYILDYDKSEPTYYDENKSAVILSPTNTDDLLVFNQLNEFVISLEEGFKSSYWVKDQIVFDWIMTNETKESDGYVMQKATTTFRGRDYVAWFTKEIPIPMGPYKFYGLPGLIMEIYDTDNIYHWTITKIEENKTIASNNLYPEHHDFLSMKQFVEKKENSDNQIDASIISRLPKGANLKSVQSTTVPVERKGIEIKFEWEED